jgi:hypothetical protein
MDGRGRTYKHAFGEDKRPAGSRVNLQMMKLAWARISLELTKKSFKKCGISNALDGIKGDMIWNSNCNNASSEDER